MANKAEASVADHTQPEATTAAVSTSDKPDIAIPAIQATSTSPVSRMKHFVK